jgi:hypothetical protein
MRVLRHPAAAQWARRLIVSAALALGAMPLANLADAQQQPGFVPREENPEEFPAGPGREETFYACTACHNFKLVAQQGMSRRQWEDILVMMNEKHGMPLLEGKDRESVLTYLESTYPPSARPAQGGWQNPFMTR